MKPLTLDNIFLNEPIRMLETFWYDLYHQQNQYCSNNSGRENKALEVLNIEEA